MTKRILLTGADGQLGSELRQRVAMMTAAYTLHATDQAELDIADPAQIEAAIQDFAPDVLINAAAYTAVDQAESQRELAFKVNAEGPANLAKAAQQAGIRMIHVSTDYVFNGQQCRPWKTDDPVAPINVYGESKLAGEQAVQRYLPDAVIIRTAWVYSRYGQNFVKTMIRLMNERDSLGIIADQIGSPTHAGRLAEILLSAVDQPEFTGISHWTDAGVASWYDFAQSIYTLGRERGLVQHDCQINPITTSDYPTPAQRPAFSVMDCQRSRAQLGHARHWREQLQMMLDELKTDYDGANA
ncbi:dTDP-4-dehydrorhamnose reductase [Nitrincola lacisaponensis]|uniref:dTDP-4-dehydrorhamnose reductase n=1 Tax=Nitrincola lacisaponensis TaxID=267850 RepID=A0A063Y385_9GAMM|nr:dTDP-4-dehydrorhamnose reductase [Nitrincola lacisaponensis]KDE39236.1 dTDP-4-dehydrorhamnose reductase [Nitrincola lacisaponensis]